MYAVIGRTLSGKLIAVATAGLIGAGTLGGVAAAATTPLDAGRAAMALPGAADVAVAKDKDRAGGIKKVLDALVAKGTITEAQENAIIAALGDVRAKGKGNDGDHRQDVRGARRGVEEYLGLTGAQLREQLKAGKSLGDVANATAGKSRDGLVAALTADANKRIDAAVTAGKMTPEQATAAKAKAATEIAKLVDRKAGPKPGDTN